MKNIKSTDILIVGSGLSGLTTALMLSKKYKITLITKNRINDCSTAWAQGGIAAALSDIDTCEKHFNDTIKNGQGLADEEITKTCVTEGPDCIKWLIDNGIEFTKKDGKIDLTLEGGHSTRRIIHNKDKTGKVIHDKLNILIKSNRNINIIENSQIIDLIIKSNGVMKEKTCLGAYVYLKNDKKIITIASSKVILATGGASKIYQFTSNPHTSTGDGIAVAWRAGCTISNMEFVQFHPTCLYHPDVKSFLISESLRGEGGKLLTPSKKSFMHKYDVRQELASRDIVARAIDHEMKKYGYSNMLLDISHKPTEFIKKRFPVIYKKCKSIGIDITKDAIPVIPASHYTCGGVKVDISGKTEIESLFVIGEAAHTGLHGANRLASNSLLECLVMSKKCSEHISSENINIQTNQNDLPLWDDSYVTSSNENIILSHNWDELRKIMWNYVGIVRSNKRLIRAHEKLNIIEDEVNEYYYKHTINSDLLELRNIIQVSRLIINSALERKESRGLHYSLDYPQSNDNYKSDTEIRGRKNNFSSNIIKFKV